MAAGGPVLGLDLGDVRIGVALSDPARKLAVPLGTVTVGRPPGELRAIAALVHEHGVSLVVLGEPRSMDGSVGPRAEHAAAFAGALAEVIDVPVELQDERLSTVEGERRLREAGVGGRRRRSVIDAVAAQVILQAWLDAGAASRASLFRRARPVSSAPMEDLIPDGTAASPVRARRRSRPSLIVAIVAFAVVATGVLWASSRYQRCKAAPDATGESVELVVPEGATGTDVVSRMAERGLINCDGFVANLLLRGTGKATQIRTGTYDLAIGMTLDDILVVLTTPPPKVPTFHVLFPEGLRIRRTYPDERTISTIAADRMGLSAARFARLAEGGTYALEPYLPAGTPTAEGFLFPATYEFVKKAIDEETVIEQMLAEFDEHAAGLPWANAENLGLTPYEIVIVASMIEREAAVAEERPLIAGVIYNRLRDGSALGIDATLLYQDPSPDGELTTADIETDNAYNTRMNAGLPPTPIASPGEDSLAAALSPKTTRFYYYVLCPSEGDGVHRFAETLSEHESNVAECLG